MDELAAMSLLVTVVDGGSLSAAARALGMPLPTVSRRISELEKSLGAQLLLRSTRRLALTDSGVAYLAACRRIVEDASEARRAAAGEFRAPRGELVIAAPIVFGRLHVLPVLTDFLRDYPEVSARLMLGDRIVDLMEAEIDVAVRVGDLPDSRLVATRVGVLHHRVCASPEYVARRGLPRSPAALADHECIAFDSGAVLAPWTFKSAGAALTVPIKARLTVTTAEAAIDAAVAGVGLARVLSYQMAAALKAGQLVVALKAFEPAPVPVSLVYGGRRQLPLKLRAFVDFAAARLRRSLPA